MTTASQSDDKRPRPVAESARVILASSSPRRSQLLRRVVSVFEVVAPNVNEERRDDSHPVEHAVVLARRKAEAAFSKVDAGRDDRNVLLIAADTVVFIERRLLEKPSDQDEARRFLRELSGRSHTVCTALSVFHTTVDGGTDRVSTATLTEVRFHPLCDHDIDWYLATEEWKGVAGGYRLQEAGAAFVSTIRGSYTNVVGLPLETLFSILRLQSVSPTGHRLRQTTAIDEKE